MNRCFTDLARIKTELKDLEARAKAMEQKCIAEHGTPGKIETKYGTLVFAERENWKVVDKVPVIEKIGQSAFNEHATIAFGKIKLVGGQAMVADLEAAGAVEFTGVTQYYSLRGAK
jgi:hypothetical protein